MTPTTAMIMMGMYIYLSLCLGLFCGGCTPDLNKILAILLTHGCPKWSNRVTNILMMTRIKDRFTGTGVSTAIIAGQVLSLLTYVRIVGRACSRIEGWINDQMRLLCSDNKQSSLEYPFRPGFSLNQRNMEDVNSDDWTISELKKSAVIQIPKENDDPTGLQLPKFEESFVHEHLHLKRRYLQSENENRLQNRTMHQIIDGLPGTMKSQKLQ